MGYRLRFDGVNDYCQFGSSMSIDFGLSAYTFEAKLILNATPSFLGGLLGRNGTTSGFFITPTLTLAMYVTNTLRYQTAANFFLADGNVHTYRLEHDSGGAWRAYRDGSLFGSGTFTSSTTAAPLIWIGQGNNSANTFCSMDLEYLEVTGPTNAQKWDANLSGGTGTTLPTTSGTNQATLINFPTDNSQWISFSSGSTVTSTIAYSVDGFTFSASSTVSAPNTTSAIAYNLDGFTFAASVTSTAPITSATISYSVDGFTFAASSTVTTPPNTASVSYNVDGFTYSASARASASSVVAYDVGAFSVVASALVVSNISTTVTYDVGALAFSVVATAPQNEPERGLVTKNNPYWRNSIFFNTSRRY